MSGQAGSITAGEIYTDVAMTSAVGDTSVKGAVVYCKVTEAVASEFRKDFVVLLRDTDDIEVDVVAEVLSVTKNGNNSCIAVRLLEADDNSATHGLSSVDRILIISTAQPEGAPMPEAVTYNPSEIDNYSQIWEVSLDLTRTAIRTKLRTEDAYKEAKREALWMIGVLMEKAFFWSIPTENTDANTGKKKRTTGGLRWFIRTYAPDNIDNYALNTDYTGYTWKQAGEDWLGDQLVKAFKYGAEEKLAICGAGTLLGLEKLAKQGATINIESGVDIGYGIKVTRWKTSQGTLLLKTHPLFSHEPTTTNCMFILEPSDLKYRYIDDVTFKPDPDFMKGGRASHDARKESYIAEALLEYHFPEKCMFLSGFNQDNELT